MKHTSRLKAFSRITNHLHEAKNLALVSTFFGFCGLLSGGTMMNGGDTASLAMGIFSMGVGLAGVGGGAYLGLKGYSLEQRANRLIHSGQSRGRAVPSQSPKPSPVK